MERGKFVVFEGIDGSGKSTQFNLVVDYLFNKSKHIDLFVTREPTRYAKEIRERLAIEHDVKKDAYWFLKAFVEDRVHHVKQIQSNLNEGTHALTDRFDLATYAYQNAQGIPFEEIKQAHAGILVPDLTIIYDCPAEVAFARRSKAGASSSFDKDLEFQKAVRENYLKLPELLKDRKIIVIDANRPIDVIFEDTKKVLDELIKEK